MKRHLLNGRLEGRCPAVFFLMPAMMVLQYGLMKLMGKPLADPQIPVLMIPVSFVTFFAAALAEEVGWQGYAIGPLQERWSALGASTILGIVWTLWHVIPFVTFVILAGTVAIVTFLWGTRTLAHYRFS